jgi:hypothetical protein
MKIITFDQIGEIIKKRYPDARNIWRFDQQYSAPSLKEFKKIINKVDPITIQFEEELFDCEDYALVMSAFVKMKAASQFPKSISFGEVTVRDTMSREVHTLNILITEDEEMLYFEPQGKLFVDGQNYKPFFVRI